MSNTNKFKEQPWHTKAVELSGMGFSGRQIAKALGRGKSQINDYLKHLREKDELTQEVVDGKKVKYLYWDLETSFMQGYFFDIWQVNIPMSQVTKQSHLLSASWAMNDDEPVGIRLTPEDVKTGNDLEVVVKLIEAINSCDVVVTFNGKKFDVKKLNTRALYWGLPPVVIPRHIDLMQDAKRLFKFPSNSMQNISQYLGEDGKISTGGSRLWQRCAEFENYEVCNAALQEMLDYNLQDINATRDLHKRFMGWSKNTPNIGTITKQVQGKDLKEDTNLLCIHCGSSDVSKIMIDGVAKQGYTSVSSFDLYRCGESSCRGVSRVNASGKALVNYI